MHIRWTDIEGFHSVRKSVKAIPHIVGNRPVVMYLAKVKLHGTNAGVFVGNNGKTIRAFSRTSLITPDCDNAGFAAWVEARKEFFASLATGRDRDFVVYGEWCGPGIQKGVACSQIPERVFAVFAVRIIDHKENSKYISEPSQLAEFAAVKGAYVIPWYCIAGAISPMQVTIDWSSSPDDLEKIVATINEQVAEVEKCDPWVKAIFEIEGVGEGLVFYPVGFHDTYDDFSNLSFKAKGTQHRVIAHSKPAQVDPSVAATAQAFADLVLPLARLEQGAQMAQTRDSRSMYDVRDVGNFIGWVSKDVNKECQAELEASGLTWKDVSKTVTDTARKWFLANAKKL